MAGKDPFSAEKEHAAKLAWGRTFEEEVAWIRQYGNHGVSPVLRNAVLAAHGIVNPKGEARNGIIFGCYRPFTTPFLLRDYIRLLELLGMDYTWFDREYCCGLPLLMGDAEGAWDNVAAASEESNRKNIDLAREKGAETLVYCCVGCVYSAKQSISESPERHRYILDLICDAMEKRTNKMAATTMGYFEGCHSFYGKRFPGVSLDWGRYRRMLGSIQGLTIVDLPRTFCCKRQTARIIEEAEERKVSAILCSCNGCYRALKDAAKGKLQVVSAPEALLQCFEGASRTQKG
jgi:Fe-S oxidoreductase